MKKSSFSNANYVENDYMQKIPGKTPFEDIFRAAASHEDLEWQLLSAHAFVESTYNPKAHNPEGSYGLMQVFLPLARNKGARTHNNDGNLPEWDNIDINKIYDPEYNVSLAAALIRENISEFGMPRAIAVYNNSHDTNSLQNGPFVSADYVAKVLKRYNDLKGIS